MCISLGFFTGFQGSAFPLESSGLSLSNDRSLAAILALEIIWNCSTPSTKSAFVLFAASKTVANLFWQLKRVWRIFIEDVWMGCFWEDVLLSSSFWWKLSLKTFQWKPSKGEIISDPTEVCLDPESGLRAFDNSEWPFSRKSYFPLRSRWRCQFV